ncbi:hypothetical protein GQ464_008055 [Rhodocaloribacter litoris]|nr:hypothetical protein [Rhodocaloribacter litoris]QXD16880.1 hypothetical protein GQ464_008055 [Rhodocaloribacter litoris]
MTKDLLLHGAYLLMVGLLAWNVYELRSRSAMLQASVDQYEAYRKGVV